jgi:hypothetical protein
MNFKSAGDYHKWLGYVHATGLAERTPGNQSVSIGGKAHKVEHGFGGSLYAQGGFMNPGFQALPTAVQNKIKSNSFKDGGPMDQLTEFNAGGSHEENPLGGIPQGVSQNGQLNLVEQGEAKSGDYVYSDRLNVRKDTAEMYGLPKTFVGKTFAAASKLANRPNSRRENDTIEQQDIERKLAQVRQAQEAQKEEDRQKETAAQLAANPELLDALTQQLAANQSVQPMGMPQGQPVDPNQMDPAMLAQMEGAQQGQPIMAYGGHMYMCGGKMYDFGGFVDNNAQGLAGAGTGALSGASTGAMLGAATGPLAVIGAPLGATIGGVIGATAGFFSGHKQDKALQEAEDERRQQQIAQNSQMNATPNSPYVTPAANNMVGAMPTYSAAHGGPLYHQYPQLTDQWKNNAGPMGQGLTNTQIYADGGELGDPPVSVGYYNNVPKRTDLMFQGNYFTTPEGNYPIPTSTSNRQTNKPIITEKGSKSVLGAPYADDYYRFKTYQADNKGKLRSAMNESYYTNNVGGERVLSVPNRYVTMDTLGYSQGRQSFPVRVVEKNIADGFGGSYAVNEFDATREQVPSLIKSMKNQTSQTNAEKVKANAEAVHQNALKVEVNRRKVLKLAPLTDYEKQQILAGKEFAYGGSFEMPRQQMYMPLDNVEAFGGEMFTRQLGDGDPLMVNSIQNTQRLVNNVDSDNNGVLDIYEKDGENTELYAAQKAMLEAETEQEYNDALGKYESMLKRLNTGMTDQNLDLTIRANPLEAAAMALPAAYNIGQGLFGKVSELNEEDYTQKGNIQPYLYDINPALRTASQRFAQSAEALRNAGISGGNYVSNMQGMLNQQNAIDAGLRSDKYNKDAAANFQAQVANSQIEAQNNTLEMQVADYNARARAAKQGMLNTGLSQVAHIGDAFLNMKKDQVLAKAMAPDFANSLKLILDWQNKQEKNKATTTSTTGTNTTGTI